mmetsp:Transcript_4687/g.9042  ORF Transcript_4687/g.9042 Transcript_4687/m.9042 type:complete len:538 (-) Transcript_4687:312-1925(-)
MQTSLSHFMSKWMDATMHTAVFHLQNKHYDAARPPNFFDNDNLNKLNLTRARTRHGDPARFTQRQLKSVVDCEKEIFPEESLVRAPGFVKAPGTDNLNDSSSAAGSRRGSINAESPQRKSIFTRPSPPPNSPHRNYSNNSSRSSSSSSEKFSLPSSVLDGFWDIIPPTPDLASSEMLQRTMLNSKYFPSSQCPNQNFACRPNGLTPPLFLQELAHISSLACAVALSTLRNDIDRSESVLDIYLPGAPWPPIDADNLPRHVRNMFQHRWHLFTIFRHWMGNDRLPKYRSKYNAARPLLILGGVSDSEIRFLQKARGPQAKAHMALGWLEEFIIREHLDGSLGEVHSAIISRLVQFLSDGMVHYNMARKIMYIPFPFPHAQLSAFFTAIMVFAVPFLMDQYTNVLWIGSLITFLTVTCLVGLHEVARELENPFRNVPNEIPLCTLQAVYNETLATMFSGYNPDSFWDAEVYQGALQAMALGKVYQRTSEVEDENATVEAIMQVATNNVSTTPGKDKNVTFATRIETKDSSPTCDYKLIT